MDRQNKTRLVDHRNNIRNNNKRFQKAKRKRFPKKAAQHSRARREGVGTSIRIRKGTRIMHIGRNILGKNEFGCPCLFFSWFG